MIDIAHSGRDSLGWRGQKTPWPVASSYRGPLLIRAARIDRAGSVRFAQGYGQHLLELRWPRGSSQGAPKGYRGFASSTLFRSAGCYGFQADGTSFSQIVVLRVSG